MVTLKNEEDTKRFATILARNVKPGSTTGLVGQLGSGKTTLVRYWVEALGGSDVSSPTFVLAHHYETPDCAVEHWDLYRLGTIPGELLEPPERWTVRVVEWADKFPEALQLDLQISIAIADQGQSREVSLSGPLSEALKVELETSSG